VGAAGLPDARAGLSLIPPGGPPGRRRALADPARRQPPPLPDGPDSTATGTPVPAETEKDPAPAGHAWPDPGRRHRPAPHAAYCGRGVQGSHTDLAVLGAPQAGSTFSYKAKAECWAVNPSRS
jgi:hypothetical protein